MRVSMDRFPVINEIKANVRQPNPQSLKIGLWDLSSLANFSNATLVSHDFMYMYTYIYAYTVTHVCMYNSEGDGDGYQEQYRVQPPH